ncbi:MAG: substrate-binding domain-containing protein [Oscillospiraceae bacterium]|nr:substrate-binding domain-containing protein [Oscillospiraceae bacterium]MBQ8801651.1 substrate-binding domain-containing protein [Clostridium sp.]
MKRWFALLAVVLALGLLAGCAAAPEAPATEPDPPTLEPTVFEFTRENFPRMDGSTSMVPLGQAIASVLLGESREDVSELVQFNRTTQSFRNLMNGDCDLLIVGEPNAAVYTEMKEAGFKADIETIASDALIFVVNADNPVDNLTTEQVRQIYAGEITNWAQVGGNDAPIVAFQRNEDAGSQALMRKLVMGDVPMAEGPKEYTIGSMGMLMEVVKSYDNSANAIGYSVYYYANDMEMAQGLKILSIDGVAPSAETIRSGAYPHLNAYYCVIPADAAQDSPNRILYEWLMTAEGQRLLALEGYVSVLDVEG